MNQIEVLVKEKSTDERRTMTYKSWLDLQDRFELLGQCDNEGNLIPGDPNLSPRHQKTTVQDVAVHADDTGFKVSQMTMEEKQKLKDEMLARYAPKVEPAAVIPKQENIPEPEKPVEKVHKKRGPKPKQTA